MDNKNNNISALISNLSPERQRLLEMKLKVKKKTAPLKILPQNDYDNQTLPMSFAQERQWIMDSLQPGLSLYNVFSAWKLSGAVNTSILEKALNLIVERHFVLSMRLGEDKGKLYQVKVDSILPFDLKDLSDLSAEQKNLETEKLLKASISVPFNISSPPMIRALLIKNSNHEYRLVITMHHIASDGWSRALIANELSIAYSSLIKNIDIPLPVLAIQYPDYALWQREWLQGDVLETQVSYWRKQLDNLPILELATDKPRPVSMSYQGAEECFNIPAPLVSQLKVLAQEEKATLFMVLMAAFQTLLMRYSSQEDFAVGTPIAGRNHPELENLVGFFVNTLVLRGDLSGNPGFRELIARTRSKALGAFTHQDLPFEKLVEVLNPPRDISRNPLFQVMFALQNLPGETLVLPGVAVEPITLHTETAKFDLSLSLTDVEGELQGSFEYATDLFAPARIQRMVTHFITLLKGIVSAPDTALWALPILSEAERHQILIQWNDTERDYPRDKVLHQLFEEQVKQSPESVAVRFSGQNLSYETLNKQANQLAHYLMHRGVGPDKLVALYLERSLDMVIGMLAILKAGGAYVPLDPDYPAERLNTMLSDSMPVVILTQSSFVSSLPELSLPHICLDSNQADWSEESESNPESGVKPEHLAYVIYTSGSTGKPKGVMVIQQAIIRLVKSQNYICLDEKTIMAQISNASFDAATFEIWGALLNGGRIIILEREISLNPEGFINSLQEEHVNSLFITTALFNEVIRYRPSAFKKVDTVLFGGESGDPQSVRRCLEFPPAHLLNVYGPTESTTFTSWYEVKFLSGDMLTIPIGQPIANTTCYILDDYMNPVPEGIPGELYIGGDGLARGYINQSELSDDKFIPNPFSEGRYLYRTGDKVCYRKEGIIEFLERIDHQVKLRGFRIELGEVESVINTHPIVYESVVMLREDRPGDKRIVAYVTVKDMSVSVEEIRLYLKSYLPDFMLPTAIVILETLPLTKNGKVDRNALPLPEYAVNVENYMAPRNDLEKILSEIWSEVLGISKVGIRDNFFELGGHSLLVVKLLEKIEKQFCHQFHINSLWFDADTIEKQAHKIQTEEKIKKLSPVVLMQKGGSHLPMFCIHTIGGGNLFHYEHLATHLKHNRSIYGLQAKGIDDLEQPDSTVEAMAAYCIKNMKKVQPNGPYILCGFSSGGTVAYEMSCQLIENGEKVARLFMVDSFSPLHQYPISLKIEKIWRLIQKKRFRELQEIFYHTSLSLLGMKRLRHLKALGESHRWALWNYQAKPCSSDMVYIEAADDGKRENPACSGWKELVHGKIHVEKVSASHGLIVKEPYVLELASRFEAFLQDI